MRRVRRLLSCTVLLSACATSRAPISVPATAALSSDNRIRLAETFRLAAAVGDQVWPAWTSAPFAVLLVTPDREILLRHPRPSADFTRVGYDSLLGTEVWTRPRKLSPNFLATFPAVGGVPTIVVGQPAATGKSSTAWVLTLMHEHFHQLQYSRPGYYDRVNALGLSRGDQSGMWMLNYAFPYQSLSVRVRFAELTQRLDSAIAAESPERRAALWNAVQSARAPLRSELAPDDYRYLAFQMWQEGVARYTELQVARWAAKNYEPSAAFRALPDFTTYAAAADRIASGIHTGLRGSPLERDGRVAFYPAGAALALVLDQHVAGWRTRYFDRDYSLDAQLP